jgi:hypothetical protein
VKTEKKKEQQHSQMFPNFARRYIVASIHRTNVVHRRKQVVHFVTTTVATTAAAAVDVFGEKRGHV